MSASPGLRRADWGRKIGEPCCFWEYYELKWRRETKGRSREQSAGTLVDGFDKDLYSYRQSTVLDVEGESAKKGWMNT